MSNRNPRSEASPVAMFVALVLGCCQAHAEGSSAGVDAAAQKLTGAASREWIFQQILTKMGASEECTQGETYRFYADHRLVIEKCENGRLGKTTHNWSLAQEGPLDIVVTIDDARYYLLFRDIEKAHLMRLQNRSTSKTDPTFDREFRLSED